MGLITEVWLEELVCIDFLKYNQDRAELIPFISLFSQFIPSQAVFNTAYFNMASAQCIFTDVT